MPISLNTIAGALNAMDVSAIGDDYDDDEVGYDDIIGYSDLVGADDDVADFLGIGAARGRPRRGANRAALKAAVLRKMQAGKQAVQVNPQQARMLQAGGFFTQGAAPGYGEITIKAQEPMRPQRLTLGGDDGDTPVGPLALSQLIILDVKVGTRSQLTSNGGIPANMFSDVSTAMTAGFQWDTIQPGCDLVISFRSIPALATVTAGLTGLALR